MAIVTVNPAPITIDVRLSKAKAFVGEPVTLNWESKNASSCESSGSLKGSQPTAGSALFTPTTGGTHIFGFSCSSSGGKSSAEVQLTVPMPVYATSYENKNSIPFNTTQTHTVRHSGIPKYDPDEIDTSERSVTFGDFLQVGDYQAFSASNVNKKVWGFDSSDSPAVVYFLRRTSDGRWIDVSDQLIKNREDRYSCRYPSYSITADFNNDKKPDVFMACHGYDFDLGRISGVSTWTPEQIWQVVTEPQVLYLSQSDGTYVKRLTYLSTYGHKAAAADLDRDGNIDVIVTHAVIASTHATPVILYGRGDGTFRSDFDTLLPIRGDHPDGGIFQVDLLPSPTGLDLIASSSNEKPRSVRYSWTPAGGFNLKNPSIFEPMIDPEIQRIYDFPLDIIRDGAYYYFWQNVRKLDGSGNPVVNRWSVSRYDSNAKSAGLVYSFDVPWGAVIPMGAQIKPDGHGNFVSYTAGCGHDYGFGLGMCVKQIKYE